MPVYEYRCLDCRKRFSVFLTYAEYGVKPVACTHCGSQNIQRKIGKVRIARGSESSLEDLSDPSNLEGLEDDPRALGKMMRKLSKETGEELPPEFNEVVDRLESGQSPEDIERDLPELGSESPETGGSLDDF